MARNIKIKEKSHAVSNGITVLVLIFAIAVCVIAAGNLYQIYGQYKAGSDEYDRIQNMVVTERAAGTEKKPEIKEVQETGAVALDAPIEIDFESLQEINNDIVGWLYVDAIPSISYPVVQGEDNEYYLHRTFEKADNFAGTVFIDCKNNKDLSSCNTIVYGHNMKNGTMFGKLKQFKEESTIQKSPY
ncbi:MAG TPA: class B sortase, partial [Candidatus Blautia faecavium]|nr:class B sortase [Candidatus Blautia faecavium]